MYFAALVGLAVAVGGPAVAGITVGALVVGRGVYAIVQSRH